MQRKCDQNLTKTQCSCARPLGTAEQITARFAGENVPLVCKMLPIRQSVLCRPLQHQIDSIPFIMVPCGFGKSELLGEMDKKYYNFSFNPINGCAIRCILTQIAIKLDEANVYQAVICFNKKTIILGNQRFNRGTRFGGKQL